MGVLAHIWTPGDGDGLEVLALWGFDPLWVVFVLIPGVLYARGLIAWTDKPATWPRWRPYCFYAGLLLITAALISPIDALADDLFTFHMLQHVILMMMGPPLVLLGAPTIPVLLGIPLRLRQLVVRPVLRNWLVRGLYRLLTFPPISWGLFAASTWGWHFIGGAYEASLRNEAVHIAQHFTFGFTAFLLWWSIIDPAPLRSKLPYHLRVPVLILTVLQNVALGAAITFRDNVLYPYYEDRIRIWGLTALEDQQAGGAMMWVVGVMMLMIAIVFTFSVWFDKSERQTREREAELDAARAGPSAAQPGRPVFTPGDIESPSGFA